MLLNPNTFEQIEKKGTLLGCAIDSASPAVAELAGLVGFDVVWADMEHRWVNPERIEDFCRGARAGGAIPMVRIPCASRDYILHALDAGAAIVVVPMVERPETAQEMVRFGKFPPAGDRGYNGATPGMGYALGSRIQNMRDSDEQTCLLAQIETASSAEICTEIVGVDGIAGGMIGPADLSISIGKPMQFDDPSFLVLLRSLLRRIYGTGKLTVIAGGHPGLIRIALEEGAQIVVCGSEANGLRAYLQRTVEEIRVARESIREMAVTDRSVAR